MNISSFNPAALFSSIPGLKSPASVSPSADSFGSVVKDAVQDLENSQSAAEHEMARAVAGESPDLHRTIIALQTADLGFQTALQVRNKLIGAYEEIMRMQV